MICNAFAVRGLTPFDEERIGALMAQEARGCRVKPGDRRHVSIPSETFLRPHIAAVRQVLAEGPRPSAEIAAEAGIGHATLRVVLGAMRLRGIAETDRQKWKRGGPTIWSLTRNGAVDDKGKDEGGAAAPAGDEANA